jgi:hypothetical protein
MFFNSLLTAIRREQNFTGLHERHPFKLFGRRDLHKHRRFRAYYSWCRGPSSIMLSRVSRLSGIKSKNMQDTCGTQGAASPTRTLGAPQTTRAVLPPPISTVTNLFFPFARGSTPTMRTAITLLKCAPTGSMPSHSAVFIVISRCSSAGLAVNPGTSSHSH